MNDSNLMKQIYGNTLADEKHLNFLQLEMKKGLPDH